MNILLVHQYFLEDNDAGGSRWNELTRSWTDDGNDVTVLAGMVHYTAFEKLKEYKNLYFKEKKQGNVTVWRCHVSESYNKNFMGRLWGYFSFMFSAFWAGIFKVKGKFDVVIVTSPPLFVGLSGYLISRWKRIPFVFEVRDLWPESAIDTGVLKNKFIIRLSYFFEAFIYRKAILINVLTPAFYTALVTDKKVSKEKIIMIPNAADFSLSEQLLNHFNRETFRKQMGLEGHFIITYVGAHGVANHLQQVLYAGKELEDTNVLFLLIGNGMEKKRLQQMAVDMKVNNVRFIDSVPKAEVFKYILASEMGASVLKKVDTFKTVYSNKTFDYMSCKKPVLMAIDGVSRELVEAAKCGVYVEPENIQDFNKKIREYLLANDRLEREGISGYNFAKQHFDREVLGKKYIEEIKLKALK